MIREVQLADAKTYLDLMEALDQESTYMLFEPGERKQTQPEFENLLNEFITSQNKVLFVAEEEGVLVGFVEVNGEDLRRIRHRADLIIGIREAYQGSGLGKALIAQAIEWSKSNDIKRLELTVITTNKKALWLFSRMGFSVEGTRRKSRFVENQWCDEFYMSLLFM